MVTTRLRASIAARLSPEATRAPTLIERLTVTRLEWDTLVRRYLAVGSRVATVLWVAFMASVILGVEWRSVVESLINSGRPVRAAIAIVFVLPTLLFVVARSLVGLARWRVQRELWRRDVARLTPAADAEPRAG
jgi:hypothetical protein